MASITKKTRRDGGTSYLVRWRDPDGNQVSKTRRSSDGAARLARTIEVQKDRDEYIDPKGAKTTLSDWRARFVATELGNRASTRARDASFWRAHIEPTLGQRRLGSIDYQTVQAWVADLSTKLAPATVTKQYQILSKTLNGAVKAGLIPANRSEGVELPTIEHKEQRFLTVSEIERLADCIDPRFRTLVLVGAYGGLRRGELFALRRGRVDLMARFLDVTEAATEVSGVHSFGPLKTKAGRRRVPLPRRVIDELIPALAPMKQGELVWTSPNGQPLRTSFRSRVWQPAVKLAGLDGLKLHSLRHTAVALWIAAGATPKATASWAGHASVSTILDVYGHLMPGSEDPVMDALDAMQAGPGAEVVALHQ